jgi:hypothetical protein
MQFLNLIKHFLKYLTKQDNPSTVEEQIIENPISMETLESTLKISHDWAKDRITYLSDLDNTEDAFALLQEFEEWFDQDVTEHDIISMGAIPDEEDT